MKAYIEEDELWPVYTITPYENADELAKECGELIEIPDELVNEYKEAYITFSKAWSKMKREVRGYEQMELIEFIYLFVVFGILGGIFLTFVWAVFGLIRMGLK